MAQESIRYVVSPPNRSSDPEVSMLVQYLEQELFKIGEAINGLSDGFLVKFNKEPDRPREGMIRFADGQGWRPSGSATASAAGVFFYNGTSWIRMDNR